MEDETVVQKNESRKMRAEEGVGERGGGEKANRKRILDLFHFISDEERRQKAVMSGVNCDDRISCEPNNDHWGSLHEIR